MNRLLVLTLTTIIVVSALVLAWDVGRGSEQAHSRLALEAANQHFEVASLAWNRDMADAWMDNAILRQRLTDYQARYSALRDEAEQAKAQRDWARSRLSWYEPNFKDAPLVEEAR